MTDTPAEVQPDIYLYFGVIDAPKDDELIEAISARPRANACTLLLRTEGGDPDVAYRIMRALQHAYESITVIVFDECFSAGTLMAIGGTELVMTGGAHLGPLDVQLLMKDELLERRSGIAGSFAFKYLTAEAKAAYRDTFLELKLGANMSTRMAAEATSSLIVGLFGPIFAQMDPLQVGELARTNSVSWEYGRRLIEDSKRVGTLPALASLIYEYPAHGFVIDRSEAKKLFGDAVRHPTSSELKLIDTFRPLAASQVATRVASDILTPPQGGSDEQPAAEDGLSDPISGSPATQPSSTGGPTDGGHDGGKALGG